MVGQVESVQFLCQFDASTPPTHTDRGTVPAGHRSHSPERATSWERCEGRDVQLDARINKYDFGGQRSRFKVAVCTKQSFSFWPLEPDFKIALEKISAHLAQTFFLVSKMN